MISNVTYILYRQIKMNFSM